MPKQAIPPSYSVSPTDRARFLRVCREVMAQRREEGNGGIGTLGEKRMHIIIKRYLTPDEDLHEVGVRDTRYVSDVRIGNEIYEVQTGPFYPMRKKIAYYLEHTDCTVTVVHPVVVNKWVTWIDPETGEIRERKKSPKHEQPVSLLPQLYCLAPHLKDPHLKFRLLLIEAEDFRLLDGWSRDRKRGSEKYERIPLDLLGVLDYPDCQSLASLIPPALPSPFTVKLFSKLTGLRGRDAYAAVHALEAVALIRPADPIGRAMAFTWK